MEKFYPRRVLIEEVKDFGLGPMLVPVDMVCRVPGCEGAIVGNNIQCAACDLHDILSHDPCPHPLGDEDSDFVRLIKDAKPGDIVIFGSREE